MNTERKSRISVKAQKFIDYYYGEEGNGNARRAAELAGYKHPDQDALKLKKKLAIHMEAREREMAAKASLSAEQVVLKLGEIAKNDKNPAQQVRALEILSKIHGLHSDKVNVHLDKQALTDDLDKALAKLTTFVVTDPSALQSKSTLPEA